MNKQIAKFKTRYGSVTLSFNPKTLLYEIEYDNEFECILNTKKSLKDAKDVYANFINELKTIDDN